MEGVVADLKASDVTDIRDVRQWAAAALPGVVFTPEQVVAAAAEWPALTEDDSGIYFLLRRGKICYVGKAVALMARLGQHRGRPFDAVAVIAGVPPECCGSLEAAYVTAWKPPWNAAPCYASFSGAKVLQATLSEMGKALICDQPELPPLTEAEIDQVLAALDF